MTPEQQALARLRVYLAHMIEHDHDHIHEIEQQMTQISDPEIVTSLTTALHDIVQANHALEASLALLGDAAPVPHHHGHAHPHGTP